MGEKMQDSLERVKQYTRLIEKQTGKAVRPYRNDGFVNMLNRYGTEKDTTEHYQFQTEDEVPDSDLIAFYEGNGLFAKIIDTPAEEAIKHGFELKDVTDPNVIDFYSEGLDELDWEETAMTAIKWARLFGGALVVMLINDGRGLDEPLDWDNIQSIDDLRVYDRSLITPDYQSMFSYEPEDPFRTRGSRLGLPEYYYVSSKYGNFRVHESRCLVFQNGRLPENTTNSNYEMWGMPEYIRIRRAVRDTDLAHSNVVKMLDRSIQAIYKMKNLAQELATETGETAVLRRLQAIDMARGLLNSITIDTDGEDYDFKQFQFSGIGEVIDVTCNFLSALTSIPQTILFGRSPAGMNATGTSDMENYYNYTERLQKRMVKSNLRYLLAVLFQAGVATGEVEEVPKIKIDFNPLWSLSELEEADLELKRVQIQQVRSQIAATYIDKQVLDATEVRKELTESREFNIETMLDDLEISDEDLFEGMEDDPEVEGGNSPDAAPAATKLPQDMTEEELAQKAESVALDDENAVTGSVGVVVVAEGKILCGTRHNTSHYGLICGPGGHIDPGETPTQAAFRETEEEFGISPKELIPLGYGAVEPNGNQPCIFLCVDYEGTPDCVDTEIVNPRFLSLEELKLLEPSMFQPFKDGVDLFLSIIDDETSSDGGPGSGNHGHEGVEGQIGGSAPKGSNPIPYKKLSKKSKEMLDARKGNVMGFGMSNDEKQKARTEFANSLKEDGAELSYNEEYDFYTVCNPECSFSENAELAECLNFGLRSGSPSREKYIEACKKAGVEPDFHIPKEEIPEGFLKATDGTPVNRNLTTNAVLASDEIMGYSSHDSDINPEGSRKKIEATEKAVAEMSQEELSAVRSYTSQYGVNYSRVNNYLAGNAEGDTEAQKNAELMSSALDHDLGAPMVVARGESDLSHITDNPKVQKMIKKVARGDFSDAKKISDEITGKTVTNPTITSTSPGSAPQGFDKLPVQIVFKAPADAKGVDITSVSAYGGGRSAAASFMGGSASYENEVAFKPGMRYRIDRCDYSMTQNGKKDVGQIFITATILTPSTENDSLELSTRKTSENPLDKSEKISKIKSKTIADGGPGSGRYPKGSGDSKFAKREYEKAVIGTRTSTGKIIKRIHPHFYDSINTRSVYPSSVKIALLKGKPSKGNKPGRTVYSYRGTNVVVQDKNAMVITVIYKGKGDK